MLTGTNNNNLDKQNQIKMQNLINEMKDIKQLKNKLLDLYLLEFEENFSDILILDKTKYLDRFGEKMSLILTDKFGDSCFDDEEFLNLNENVENIFINNYYQISYDFLKKETNNFLEENYENDNNENDNENNNNNEVNMYYRRKSEIERSKINNKFYFI
jgi:hypothetical protein